ncbi:MAG: glycerate kinase, partial [Planctomycetota bacterium]
MKVLIAPDSFKEALDAESAARAIADGVRIARPDAAVDRCPLGDGGEGSAAIIAQAHDGVARSEWVHDALGRRRPARWWWIEASQPAVIELAQAAGLASLAPGERDPRITTTYGVGELLRAAGEAGCASVTLCVGGSATVDGGAGCLQALGWRFLDRRGRLLEGFLCGGRLRDVARIEPPPSTTRWRLTVLCDVDNPLTGPDGAAPV